MGLNEIKLAKFRIDYLSSHVGHTVIGESKLTHAGNKKELLFRKWHEELPELLREKITIIEIPLVGIDDPMQRDIFSREYVMDYARQNFMGEKFFISDLDEIPSVVQARKLQSVTGLFHFLTPTFYRKANWQLRDKHSKWSRGVCGEIELNTFPNAGRFTELDILHANSGVHLSYLGMDSQLLEEKISSFAHTEIASNPFADQSLLDFCDYYRIDHLGRARTAGFGIFRVTPSNTRDLADAIQATFPELLDTAADRPNVIRRFWASIRLAVWLRAYQDNPTSRQNKDFKRGIVKLSVVLQSIVESLLVLGLAARRNLPPFGFGKNRNWRN